MKIPTKVVALVWLLAGFGTGQVCLGKHQNYCHTYSIGVDRASAVCPGKVIPARKSRNFIFERLLCAGGSDSQTRTPASLDEEAWRDLRNLDPHRARQMLRSLPTPKWQGQVQYATSLHWSWEECQQVTSFDCGSRTVCETKKDLDGNDKEHCHKEPKTCYMDVVVHSSELCSEETLHYGVEYLRADGDTYYPDRLANGYDLLPGEHEQVMVDNGIGPVHAATLNPVLSFSAARNEYDVQMSGAPTGSAGLACRHNSNDHVDFQIKPIRRIRSRSGNGFALPKDIDGTEIEPLAWGGAADTNGHWQARSFPVLLRVQDYSASSITEFARDAGDLFKNIDVRLQLYNDSAGWPWPQRTIYINEGRGAVQSFLALADQQRIRRSKLWELALAPNSNDPYKNLYRSAIPWFLYYPARLFLPPAVLSYDDLLQPGTRYRLSLSVYQKGSSIYLQSCEDEPDAWDCQLYAGGGWFSPRRYENSYFSDKTLDVTFTTPDHVNQRSWWPLFWNVVGTADKAAILGLAIFAMHRLF